MATHRPAAAGASRTFFDLWSRVYDFRLVQRATYRPVHDAVLRALRAGTHRSVLDVGCGTGQLSERIAALGTAAPIVGCDFSTGMLGQARVRAGAGGGDALPARLAWVGADAAALPFADRTFEVVVSTEAFHWFPDQEAALREMFRVLLPGGRLLVALVNTPSALLSDVVHLGSRLLGEPLYWPTTAGMRAWVEAAGFLVDRQTRILRFPGFLLPPVLTEARRPR